MKVNITGYGERPFRVTKILFTPHLQFKGEYKLPKNTTKTNGKKWMELDYYFTPEQIIE